MSGARVHRKAAFFWQAVLILLPVAVLTAIGWASLRQDRILAEHDAREQAQALADQLVPTMWTQFTASPGNESSNEVVLRLDASGALVFPPPCDPAPVPAPLTATELPPEQAGLWAESQITRTNTLADAVAACRRFIDSNPPERFAAAAQYQLGLLLLQQNNWPESAKSFAQVVSRYPDVVGESGLPLQPLAQFKLIELRSRSLGPTNTPFKINLGRGTAERNGMEFTHVWIDAWQFIPLDSFCSNIVYHPTLLTPFLLGQLRAVRTNQLDIVQKWQRVWAEHARAREVFAAASDHLRSNASFLPIGTNRIESAPSPAIFWFTMPGSGRALAAEGERGPAVNVDENWIATRADEGTNSARFICRPESDCGFRIEQNTEHIPAYLGVGVQVAGRRITAGAPSLAYWHSEYVSGGKGGGQFWGRKYSDGISTNLLASATRLADGVEQLKVNIYLTSPDELFTSQQSRARWFGLLVAASTVAALIGLFAASRAFHRQLRLAEMKSNFVSSVSHELRAPIASVRLMAESLERGKVHEPKKQGEYYRFIVQECRRLSSLIENVLDFSRIEQGRKQYEFEPTDLLALTRETVKLLEPYAEEKGVRLELATPLAAPEHSAGGNVEHPTTNIRLPTSNIELEVDGRAIQQALVNLIDNAIKHSPKGQTVIVGLDTDQGRTGVPPVSNFSGEDQMETGRMPVLLYVEDHGAGIPPGEHEKIFERFYRLGSELRRETQGVGIGLSIVKHIVEAHGGRVTVRSNVGEGSRFTIELPCNRLNK
jgi:signal transduction histidine kinase